MYTNWKETQNEERLTKAVEGSISIAGVCRELGLRPVGGNIATMRFHITRLGLSVEHHKGVAWNKDNYKIPTSSSTSRSFREHLIREYGYKCWICGLSEWENAPIPLELDHIDGNNTHNDWENLRVLCCNCHAQTPTFRNKKRLSPVGETRQTRSAQNRVPSQDCQFKSDTGYFDMVSNIVSTIPATLCIVCQKPCRNDRYWHMTCNLCVDCQKPCSTLRCRTCSNSFKGNKTTKIKWPSAPELTAMVRLQGFEGTGRLLGVGGNSVRKHLKNAGVLNVQDLTPFNNGRGARE